MIRRLLTEYGLGHWRRYAAALALMAVSAACMAATAYLLRPLINGAYIFRDVHAITQLGVLIVALAVIKGASTY
ncbi:MAG TPA: ABC transporter ATP-binding protein, partial [Xanthobacteraceae bacterium]|nr:ABC transporter ATP-binding protein [Xanthobacteraceae bacterium]